MLRMHLVQNPISRVVKSACRWMYALVMGCRAMATKNRAIDMAWFDPELRSECVELGRRLLCMLPSPSISGRLFKVRMAPAGVSLRAVYVGGGVGDLKESLGSKLAL